MPPKAKLIRGVCFGEGVEEWWGSLEVDSNPSVSAERRVSVSPPRKIGRVLNDQTGLMTKCGRLIHTHIDT